MDVCPYAKNTRDSMSGVTLGWSGVSDHIHVDELKRCIYKYLNTCQKSCQEFIYQLILKI